MFCFLLLSANLSFTYYLYIGKTAMRKREEQKTTSGNANVGTTELVSYYNIVKKTIQEYTEELMRHCRYKTMVSQLNDGTILDDRSRLIDLYDSCLIQDAHMQAVIETLFSNMLGERYHIATQDSTGKWIKDVELTKIIQGSQFEEIIKQILYAEFYGFSCIQINPSIDPETGFFTGVTPIERRNVLASQSRIVKRQGLWDPGWNIGSEKYRHNYILFYTGGLGLFSSTTPIVLAKKYTLANWVNFSHTYGQPIIHGKTSGESTADRNRLANDIANAAQKKVIVTGLDDELDVKTFTMSNSEKIYDSLINFSNTEISNLILGSESMAGATQSYVGSTKAHEDIFRARIKTYRRITENAMNEKVFPQLKYWGIVPKEAFFKYSNQVDMSMDNKIKLYDMLTNKYEVDKDTIENDFGVNVGNQINLMNGNGGGSVSVGSSDDNHVMSDEEYYKRYGHRRGENVSAKVNFLSGTR